MESKLRILLIEDNPADVRLVRESLARRRSSFRCELEAVETLQEGLDRLALGGIDVVLLDLSLPDGEGLATFETAFAAAADVPILVLTGLDDEELAARAVRSGAQDYLPKDGLEGGALLRSLRHAVERKELERELARNAEQLHLQADVLAHVRDSVIVTDLEGRITYWNEGARELFGYTAEEVLGQTPTLLYPRQADAAGELADDLSQTLSDGGRRFPEWRALRKDGTEIWIDVRLAPMRDRHGELAGFVGVAKDVTESLRAAHAQERLTAILEATTDFVGMASPAGRVLYMNQAGRAMVGLGPGEDPVGTDIGLYSPEWATRMYLEEAFPVAARDGVWTGRSVFVNREGEEFPVSQVIVSHRRADGTVEHFSTIARDITERLRYEEALRESAMRLRLLIEQMPALLWTVDNDLRFTSNQGGGLAAIGFRPGEVEGRRLLEFRTSDDPAVVAHRKALSGESVSYDAVFRDHVFEAHVEPLRDASGSIVGCIGVALDVTGHRRAEEDLGALNETLKALIEASPLAIVALDADSQVTLWSPAAERTFGWKSEEIVGRPLPIVPADRHDEHLTLRESVLAGQRFVGIETRRCGRAGEPIDLRISAAPLRDARGQIRGIAEFLEDINDRKRAERAIRRLASMPEQSPEPLVELDLAGNALYVNQAARSRFPDLQALGSWHPVLGNLAGILPRFRHGERKSFSFEVSHEQRIYHQMVYYVADGALVRIFLQDITEQRQAEAILKRESLQDRLSGSTKSGPLRLENELRRAIELEELRMFYQPILRLRDGAVTGLEALLRWPRAERGMVLPSEFIPVAEEAGLILPLFYWGLGEVCRWLSTWREIEGYGPPPVIHLNLSSRMFSDPSLVHRIESALAEAGVDGERLVLEITESVLMEDPETAADTLKRIKALRVGLALDDFGTGYSSLSYLQQFPIDSLKIDRSFVAKLGELGENREILHAILSLAHRLDIEVIAEGVETESQLARLAEMGCGLGQGFLFSRPVDLEAVQGLLAQPPWRDLFSSRASSPPGAQRSRRGNLKAVGGSAGA
jgi:PAS domain S-box-containing protein